MNMFARRPKTITNQAAVDELNRKKLQAKILDVKKEVNSRLRYLKNYIESTDNSIEIKSFFDQNYSQIYFIFYESFILVEINLKQKLNKINREELDLVLFIFQKILLIQPERINQRWQSRSIGRLLQKLLHVSNTKYIKITGLRLFLIWYQILNKNRTQIEELMFQKLIQGFDLFHSNVHTSIGLEILNAEAQKVFQSNQSNSTSHLFSAASNYVKSTLYQYEITYLIPHSSQNEHIFMLQQSTTGQQTNSNPSQTQSQSSQVLQSNQTQSHQSNHQPITTNSNNSNQLNIYGLTAELLRYMLSFMQNDFLLIEWSSDRLKQSVSCYEFIFDEFKRFYLSYMFPNAFIKQNITSLSSSNSLNVYSNLDLLSLINTELSQQNQPTKTSNVHDRHQHSFQTDDKKQVQLNCKEEIIKWLIDVLLINESCNVQIDSNVFSSSIQSSELKSLDDYSCDESIDSNLTSLTSIGSTSTVTASHLITQPTNKQLIQKVLLSTQSNVNLVHEILRNTYFLNFDDGSQTVKLVLDAYKKWFLNEAKMPSFMSEPNEQDQDPVFILSNDENEQDNSNQIQIGSVKCLQIFYYHSSNLLLNRSYLQKSEKLKNICCYLLDIYKSFIKKIHMDSYTWTMLIKILLRVCNFLFSSNSDYILLNNPSGSNSNPRLNESNSLSQLIKLTTETTLMAMIKATYNFNLSNDLWDQLVNLLQIVNSNHDVVDKWMESIDDLIRQIFKYIYNIDLSTVKNSGNDDETDALSNSSSLMSSTRSNSISSSQIEEKRKMRQRNRDKLLQATTTTTQIGINSSSSNYLLSNPIPATLGSIKSSVNQANPVPNTVQFNRQASTKHSLQNTFRDDTYLHTLASSLMPSTNDIEQSKSPSLTDENFMNLTESKPKKDDVETDTENDSQVQERVEDEDEDEIDDDSFDFNSKYFSNQNKRRRDDDSYNGEDDEGDCTSSMNETDSNDSTSYDKSATLKAANQIDQLNAYNTNTIKSSTLTNINKFSASEKSIYYSSELLADKPNTSGSSSINSVTSPTLQIKISNQTANTSANLEDDSSSIDEFSTNDNSTTSKSNTSQSNNNSFSNNTPNTQTTNLSCSSSSSSSSNLVNQNLVNNSSSPNLKQYSPKIASPNQPSSVNSSVPPPLPPLPANLPSKFYLLNQQQMSKVSVQSDSSDNGQKSRKSIENEQQQTELNSIQISSTSSNSSSVQASPLGKLTISMGQSVEFGLSSPKQQKSDPKLNKNDERSASFIMDTPKINQQQQSGKSNQSLLTMINSTRVNRQSLSIVTNNSELTQEVDLNKKFKTTSLMLLKRLFGCMGNVNLIKDPSIHRKIFDFILSKWIKLSKVKDEMLSLMSVGVADICELIMPQSYFASWLFESIHKYLHELSSSIPPSLSVNYQSASLIAYKILANVVIKSAQLPSDDQFYSISCNFLDLFYITIHYGLVSNDKNILNCIIQSCSTKFWHLMFESSSLLIKDFINACLQVDNQGPKFDAISILGSFICLPDYFGESITFLSPVTSVKPSSNSPSIQSTNHQDLNTVQFSREEFKNLLISTISNFDLGIGSDLENLTNFNNSKCVLLCSLTCFLFDEIISQSKSNWNTTRLSEACKKLFKDLEYRDTNSPILVKMSCDNLRFLACLANFIFQKDIQFAINIINELNQCLVKLINNKPSSTSINENYEKAIISNMFALLEWCMNMPLEQLKDQDRATLLKNNFKLIIHISNTFKTGESLESEHIHLAARFIISHLLNHLNHYPYGVYGPSKICSSCNETSDMTILPSDDSNNNTPSSTDDLSVLLFDQPNIQFFTVNNQFLISFVELPKQSSNDFYFNDSYKQKLKISPTLCRFIVRDFSGKYCWDCCLLNSLDHLAPKINSLEIPVLESVESNEQVDHQEQKFEYQNLTNLSSEHQIPKNLDLLENVINYVNYSSPECRLDTLISSQQPKDSSLDELKHKIISSDDSTITESHDQKPSTPEKNLESEQSQATSDKSHYFNLCKSFVHQMGLLSWEKRQTFNLLHKSAQLLRELKSLDDQACRETHKIALIYIAKGQQDKQSILSNEKGSKDYHDFLSALAWPVNLETHEGFMGGLQHVSSQLKTAPYYSNSLCEVLFHVSTQMNNANDQNKISKWRHLGNDSVQIIWSEHTKDYDRSILATEFADVIICIYPMSNGLYRIQIIKKHSVGYFGPLFDGAILHKSIMPHLIRATAVNASRVLLSNTKGYQDFYVHRAHAINNILSKQTEKQTFEQFVVDVYSPNINTTLGATKTKSETTNVNVHSPIQNNVLIQSLSQVGSGQGSVIVSENEKQLIL